MASNLTYEKILELFEKQAIQHSLLLEEQTRNFDNLLLKEREERERSFNLEREEREKSFNLEREERERSLKQEREERERSLKQEREEREKSRRDFDKRLGELTGTWGRFVQEMVKPRIISLFQEKGIAIETTAQFIEGIKDGQRYYEIDLLLVNSHIAVVVEIKSKLSREDVDEHLDRMQKIQKIKPKIMNLSNATLYGAVAGMIVENEADRYAYKNGLFVLRQKGNIVEIVNDKKFVPKEWKVEY